MSQKILFIGTPFMNIYQDIIDEFHKQGYEVDFIAEQVHPEDPDNVRGKNQETPEVFLAKNTKYWSDLLCTEAYSKTYDILFVLDGQSIAPCVFSILRKRNSGLHAVNYLFDTTRGVYRFDKNFPYYDNVFTFDLEESAKYGIGILPIYWAPAEADEHKTKYKFFGLGRYKRDRAQLFKALMNYSNKHDLPYYLKLQGERFKCFPINYLIKNLFGKYGDRPTFQDYYSYYYIIQPVPLAEYRKLTAESEIIVDTNAPHQDGLTARFMWALGQGKKIITTNKAAAQYDFYTPKQIFIVEDVEALSHDKEFEQFINEPFLASDSQKDSVSKYRIDNWVKHLLNQEVCNSCKNMVV